MTPNDVKRPYYFIAICAGTILFAAGCGKTDTAPSPKEVRKASSAQEMAVSAALPPPALPAPNVPKGAEAPSPMPGQANDHSSPAFKDGGKADPHK